MKPFILAPYAIAVFLSGCAAFPELDGKPVAAMHAADFKTSRSPVWTLDFGNRELRRMLSEADRDGLDVAEARARFRAADLTLDQIRSNAGLSYSANASTQIKDYKVNAPVSFEPDLTRRFEATLHAAGMEHSASGLDLLIARRTLAREVVQGWIALAEARTTAARITSLMAAEEEALQLLRLRWNAGEATGADLAGRQQALIRAQAEAVSAQSQIALAETRLRALGVTTVPDAISLKSANRSTIPERMDLAATQSAPQVCAAWLRFKASDASRAATLASSRPGLVLTSSLSATAKTLTGLIAGNAAAVANSVQIEVNILDTGQSRRRLDQARLTVAQAEIYWLRSRNQAEVSALEAVIARQSAEAALAAALNGWKNATTDLERVKSRYTAGIADKLELVEAERNVATAQRDVDTTRAEAFRAATTMYDTLPPIVPECSVSARLPAQ